jgi:predicted nucleotidyltransferase component of viral defense system
LLAALDARLRAASIEQGIDINRLRRQVAFERLLVRLAADGRDDFGCWILKGGLALELRLANQCRSTKDLDLALIEPAGSAEDVRDRLFDALSSDPTGDHFAFAVGPPRKLAADQAGRAGWRFPVDAKLAGKTFVNVRLDVVARAEEITGAVEALTFDSTLAFAGYPASVTVAAIDVHQHAAEKLHALTKSYGERPNTRTKELVDLVLLLEQGLVDPRRLAARLRKVFAVRASHQIPSELPVPPFAWHADYVSLVAELDVETRTLDAAHTLVNSFWKACVTVK